MFINFQSSAWPRGKGLGGSGQLNYMVHFPGIRSDFERWEQEGAHGWGYDSIRPVIERVTCERPQDIMPRFSCPRTSYKIAVLGMFLPLVFWTRVQWIFRWDSKLATKNKKVRAYNTTDWWRTNEWDFDQCIYWCWTRARRRLFQERRKRRKRIPKLKKLYLERQTVEHTRELSETRPRQRESPRDAQYPRWQSAFALIEKSLSLLTGRCVF